MHTIQMPDDQFKKLSEQAAAAGFTDIAAYIKTLVDEAAFDARCGMSDDEIRQSAEECRRIHAEMKAGAGRDANEAFTELGRKFGFNTPT